MKTLREYIDQLDEISRRDFLKGAGVGAVAGALGTVGYQAGQQSTVDTIPSDPQVYYLIAYLSWLTSLVDTPMAKQMKKLHDLVRIEFDSLPENQYQELKQSYNRGQKNAMDRKKFMLDAARQSGNLDKNKII